jgi:tRNA dimethylallyltransferase
MVSPHLTPLVIAGPTGSGKSALALALALKYDGEIICADSRQFYKFMRIGTASPSDEDLKLVPHHGFNSIDPKDSKIDAGFFITFAHTLINTIKARHKRPIIVGGTGLYLRALRYGLSDVPRSDPKVIKTLEKEAALLGVHILYERLITLDPKSTMQIKASDKYRIIRALAIFNQTHRKPSSLRQSFSHKKALLNAHWLLKKIDKADLEKRLLLRIHTMLKEGLVDEADNLRRILPAHHWALDVMGYKEALLYIDNFISYDQMIENIVIRHRQYAKRQLKWFKNEDFYRFKV